ncbi:mechanosensitive ion channel family protein [Bosea sp. 685]|uniref:mechanosensitive ion channel family protein n=1 Tax=Bosea sp. 685 TaxID=3080057 RepID=UPI0028929952|nr:mechanosensitive ion channel family protein [Bosea sp. 685]WNJ88598.1 mechanosensitive ion channel family protein [Bosea sp. 685]
MSAQKRFIGQPFTSALRFLALAPLFCLFLCLHALSLPALAQTAAPPAGISQEQFDALVEAIGRSVVAKLKAPAPAVAGGGGSDPAAAATPDPLEARVAQFVDRGAAALAAFPELGRRLAEFPRLIVQAGDGRGLSAFLLLLFISAALALAIERLVAALFGGLRTRLGARVAATPGPAALLPIGAILTLDLVGVAAVWLVSYGAIGIWFSRGVGQDKLAAAVLAGIFAWRLYMLAFRFVLRPSLAGARLAAMDDGEAAALYRRITLIVLLIMTLRIVIRLLIATATPAEAIAAGQILVTSLVLSFVFWMAARSRIAVGRWLTGLASARNSLAGWLGAHWLTVAAPLFLALGLTQIYGAVVARYTVPNAVLLTLNALIALIVFQTLARYLTRARASAVAERVEGEPAADAAAIPAPRRLTDVVVRCIRTAILLAIMVFVAQSWIVDVFALVDEQGWRTLTRSSLATAVTLFLAFVAWELVDFFTRATPAAAHDVAAAGDGGGGSGSRLATMLPLLRVVLAITIGVLALLIVLSEMGVNIAPLLAGASVFGLALSFGSQALVRDIVSGIFYLSDDAFRIGEYIDCGKAKGSVEGFTLRSIRLRHQNGQVHTIPFGQLGQITNFSRDWATVKFNLRFKRDTDLEKLRKTVKKIGDQMQADPEFANDFIAPLRMQGVADILDNAILVRFKFTVKPIQPSYVQRVAVKTMVTTFPTVGIEFADSMVAVQTMGAGGDQAAAAAANSAQNRSRAELALSTEAGQ